MGQSTTIVHLDPDEQLVLDRKSLAQEPEGRDVLTIKTSATEHSLLTVFGTPVQIDAVTATLTKPFFESFYEAFVEAQDDPEAAERLRSNLAKFDFDLLRAYADALGKVAVAKVNVLEAFAET